MKQKSITGVLICLSFWLLLATQAMAQEVPSSYCFKSECWKEQGLTRLATHGCPTPTLFVKSALRELESYVKKGQSFGLSKAQIAQIVPIYEHANMVVAKARGQMLGLTEMLSKEMKKDIPDHQRVKKLIDEVEKSCWDMISVLAEDVNKARAITKQK